MPSYHKKDTYFTMIIFTARLTPITQSSLYRDTRTSKSASKEGLERWTGDRVVKGSNPAAATYLLRNFGNSVYPTLPVSFGGDTESRRSLLSGVYAGGSK